MCIVDYANYVKNDKNKKNKKPYFLFCLVESKKIKKRSYLC